MRVGERARDQLIAKPPVKAYAEFKRMMGTDHAYHFAEADVRMKPEELSAEVLKILCGSARAQYPDDDLSACVITVPAAFEQRQCAATKSAAQLAGINQAPLLQEPVAAALAFGFQAERQNAYWFVYDFGGGTFDAALIRAEDGAITVVNHLGDNHLGGSEIDWAIVEQIVAPRVADEFGLEDFTRANKERWGTAFRMIKRSAEVAKIGLSLRDKEYLEDCKFEGPDGGEIEVDLELTRADVARVAEPLILRSAEISHRVLKEKGLPPSAVERVILVGGPTYAPYFREILAGALGMPLDTSVNPMTVVAKGAAVFAATQKREGIARKATRGQYNVEMRYKPVGADLDPTVRGVVSDPQGKSVEGFTIEFVRGDDGWRSGRVPLKTEGNFRLNLQAKKGCQNTYSIELHDGARARQIAIPDHITYTVGLAISEQPVCMAIAVALANNESLVFFEKGAGYPIKKTQVLKTARPLKAGETAEIVQIPVVEGGNPKADRNVLVGALVIEASRVQRDLPAGTDVEVTLSAKEPGTILVTAYLPLLDEEFEARIEYDKRPTDAKGIDSAYARELDRLQGLREKAENVGDEASIDELDKIEVSPLVEEFGTLVESAKADEDSARKAYSRLLELRVKLDEVEDRMAWPGQVAEARETVERMADVADEFGSDEQKRRADRLKAEVDEAIASRKPERLKRKCDQVFELNRDILFEQPGFWVGFFNRLVNDRGRMLDRAQADRLVDQGRRCIEANKVQGLRNVVFQLLDLLPQEEAEAARRAYGSGVLRGN